MQYTITTMDLDRSRPEKESSVMQYSTKDYNLTVKVYVETWNGVAYVVQDKDYIEILKLLSPNAYLRFTENNKL